MKEKTWRILLIVLVLSLVGAIGVALARRWGGGSAPAVEAQVTRPDLSLEVQGAGCTTRPPGPSTCRVAAGSQFAASVYLNDISALSDRDGDTKAGYGAIQVRLNFSAGLTLRNRPGAAEVVWPDCPGGIYAAETKGVDTYRALCAISAGANESLFVGRVLEADFTCTPAESAGHTVALVHGVPLDSHLLDEVGGYVETGGQGARETLTIDCVVLPTPTPTSTVGPAGDTDRDGCSDQQELGPDPRLGGRRDPFNFWDFFDTPTLPGNTRDKSIDVGDITRVVARFGGNDANGTTPINRNSDPLSEPPPPPAYHPAFDRGEPIPGGDPWDLAPANGSVSVGDIVSSVQQFGHSCWAPP